MQLNIIIILYFMSDFSKHVGHRFVHLSLEGLSLVLILKVKTYFMEGHLVFWKQKNIFNACV